MQVVERATHPMLAERSLRRWATVTLVEHQETAATSDPDSDGAPVGGLTRRDLFLSTFATTLLVACRSGDQAGSEAPTRPVQTVRGTVTIPVRPRRIVSISIQGPTEMLDNLAAPMIATQHRADGVWDRLSQRARDLPSVGARPEVDVEAVAAQRPDLVVGRSGDNAEIYDWLSQIAPTVLLDDAVDWRARFQFVGDLVGEPERARQLLAAVDTRLVELQAGVERAWPNGLKVSLLRLLSVDGSVGSINTSNPQHTGCAGRLLRQINGVTVTGDHPGEFGTVISAERLREVDADVIVYFAGGGAQGRADAAHAAVVSTPLWQGLNAVRAGRAHRVDSYVWFDGYGTTSANLALDDLFQHLT